MENLSGNASLDGSFAHPSFIGPPLAQFPSGTPTADAPSALSINDQLVQHFLGALPIRFDPDVHPDYVAAFNAFENVVGRKHVLVDDGIRDEYAKTTLAVGTRPAGVVRPRTVNEVQHIVVAARKHRVPLHAISCGKNWGYGDACAPEDGYVIIDLRQMNCIREINVELGYAVIEPGVTQGQIYDHLTENEIPLMLDVTGAGPEASVVGNVLQRGFGHTPYGDRFRHICGMEAVLYDGRILRTGFWGRENSKAAYVYPYGLGPYVDGLFTQSNVAIITQMCIWLMPRPESIKAFALKVADQEAICQIVERLRPLRLHEIVRSTVHIANDLRAISGRQPYPWDLMNGMTPLSDQARRFLQDTAGVGAWNVIGAVYGTKKLVRAAQAAIRCELRSLGRVHFFDGRKLGIAKQISTLLRRFGIAPHIHESVTAAEGVYRLLCGEPTREHQKGVFWRARAASPGEDPVNAGLYWLAPVLPMTGKNALEVVNIAQKEMQGCGFDPLITLISISGRCLVGVISICYDKMDASNAQQAKDCYERLSDLFNQMGYFPYRVSSVS